VQEWGGECQQGQARQRVIEGGIRDNWCTFKSNQILCIKCRANAIIWRKVKDICIWTNSFQYLERSGTTSMQFLNGSRRKSLKPNSNHDIILYLELHMTSTSVSMNFILKITCLNFIANLMMQIMQMLCECFSRLRNSNMWGHG
jgi:hypothetical protein